MAEHIQRLFATEECERLVRQVLDARRLRDKVFEPGLFSDPAWDILLHLYLSELRHEPLTVEQLAGAIGLSRATTIRWLDVLAAGGLTRELSAVAEDCCSGLSAKGASAMRRWFGLWLNAPGDGALEGLLERMLPGARGDA